jgi:Putative Ig domain
VLGACRDDDRDLAFGSDLTNSAPVIAGTPETRVVVGATYEFIPEATDTDGDILTFSIANRPGWAAFSPSTGRLSGRPPASVATQVYENIRISVSDGGSVAELPAYDLEVASESDAEANTPPSITGSPATTATVGNSYSFMPDTVDPDGDTLSFGVANRPSWAAFDTSTGQLSGAPAESDVGVYTGIVIAVSDGVSSRSLAAFDITVSAGAAPPPVNHPPVISGSPATSATVGTAYSFQPTASDPDSQTLTFSISSKPAWATFSTSTGRLSGTPGSGAVGEYQDIVISASDGTASGSLPVFTITVRAAVSNRAPTLSGSPSSTVLAGQPYDFTPSATDPDGDALRFTITNKPAWASFSTSSGRLWGSPDSTDAGTYAGIRITVNDGVATASLTFDISVEEPARRSVTLSWTAPTQNEDGSPLTNLKGFRVYYGTSSSALDSMIEIPSAGVTSAAVEELSPATWYFGVKAYTTDGFESDFSNIASQQIN